MYLQYPNLFRPIVLGGHGVPQPHFRRTALQRDPLCAAGK